MIMKKEEWDVCVKHQHRSIGQIKRRMRERKEASFSQEVIGDKK